MKRGEGAGKRKQILSIPGYHEILLEYANREELKDSYEKYGCRGLEIIRCDEDSRRIIGNEMISGLHMIFYPMWLDFFMGNERNLQEEFGNRSVWEEFYRGSTFDSVMLQFESDLRYAAEVKAEYVVFHVSDVTIEGTFIQKHRHTDEEVVEVACMIINSLLDGKNYEFDFLIENLWWPGFTLTNPKLTMQMLEQVNYKKKGIMLDTGHLMCSNPDIANQEDGCRYLHKILSEHEAVCPEFCEFVKGIHLHQSVSGGFVKEIMKNPPKLKEEYYERFAQVYEFLGKVDTHKPWETPEVCSVIDRIDPKFLVHELFAANRKEREALLKIQVDTLSEGICP